MLSTIFLVNFSPIKTKYYEKQDPIGIQKKLYQGSGDQWCGFVCHTGNGIRLSNKRK
jgi:hypothetical protein